MTHLVKAAHDTRLDPTLGWFGVSPQGNPDNDQVSSTPILRLADGLRWMLVDTSAPDHWGYSCLSSGTASFALKHHCRVLALPRAESTAPLASGWGLPVGVVGWRSQRRQRHHRVQLAARWPRQVTDHAAPVRGWALYLLEAPCSAPTKAACSRQDAALTALDAKTQKTLVSRKNAAYYRHHAKYHFHLLF